MVEIILSVVLLILLACFNFYEQLLMPMGTHVMLSLALILTFFFFTAFIWKEKGRDEREIMHVHFAGRLSFIVGSFILVVAIVMQSFTHNIDPWLIYALSGMVLTKLLSHLYSEYKK